MNFFLKAFACVVSIAVLFGCNGCWTPMPVVSCGVMQKGTPWPAIATRQKENSLGRTNAKQRWNDAVACGAKYGDESLMSAVGSKNGQEMIFDFDKARKFDACMENKGYRRLWPAECGTQDPKENKGKCNL
ncbi:hypothetical protein [Brachymonas sp. M4Q-1]|uniref:hypothetical protein n=1 Tax=Brachymonas sp. M4Q-1 TaxID=3416906 RepID=UPI003CE68C9E